MALAARPQTGKATSAGRGKCSNALRPYVSGARGSVAVASLPIIAGAAAEALAIDAAASSPEIIEAMSGTPVLAAGAAAVVVAGVGIAKLVAGRDARIVATDAPLALQALEEEVGLPGARFEHRPHGCSTARRSASKRSNNPTRCLGHNASAHSGHCFSALQARTVLVDLRTKETQKEQGVADLKQARGRRVSVPYAVVRLRLTQHGWAGTISAHIRLAALQQRSATPIHPRLDAVVTLSVPVPVPPQPDPADPTMLLVEPEQFVAKLRSASGVREDSVLVLLDS